jgi:peptidoglycan-associated lipoprotein
MPRASRLLLLALPIATLTVGCRPKRPAPVTPAAVDTSAEDAERARREAEAREAARRAEEERLRAEREAAEERLRASRGVLEAVVYFAYDQSDLDAEARRVLEAKLPVLQANPALQLRIAGHTDERGSDEYNLALGQRRAAAAKRFLTQRGIEENRIELASFGEEQPACTESTESCWAQNRRDAFEITAGALVSAQAGRSAP